MAAAPNTVFLSLGSNLGERELFLQSAISELRALGTVEKTSPLHETPAWGKTDQPNFLNLAVKMSTELAPLQFLQKIQEIENKLGRERHEKWGSRTIDIDIIFWNTEHINLSELVVPHPYWQERDFVLAPLREMLPDAILAFWFSKNSVSARHPERKPAAG
jgi:2-amino-4-hydroxy-6-hydroxymethyldihydropteridine diphosphokinase